MSAASGGDTTSSGSATVVEPAAQRVKTLGRAMELKRVPALPVCSGKPEALAPMVIDLVAGVDFESVRSSSSSSVTIQTAINAKKREMLKAEAAKKVEF